MRILELKRRDMIDLTKDYSEERYKRRLDYKGKIVHRVGPQEYSEDYSLSLLFFIGDYRAIIEIKDIKYWVDARYPKGIPTRREAEELLKKAISELDLGVFCTCADFKYRFHYLVTLDNGLPKGVPLQTIPANRTNPFNQGYLCKHLTSLLSAPSRWVSKAVTLFRESIIYDRAEEVLEYGG